MFQKRPEHKWSKDRNCTVEYLHIKQLFHNFVFFRDFSIDSAKRVVLNDVFQIEVALEFSCAKNFGDNRVALIFLVLKISVFEAARETTLHLLALVIHVFIESRNLCEQLSDFVLSLDGAFVVPDILESLRFFLIVFYVPNRAVLFDGGGHFGATIVPV